VSTANAATTTATNANSKADQAVAAVANSINFTLVANVAAIPASPANNTYLEIGNSTGLQSFTPLAGIPAGFVGDPGLTTRIVYDANNQTWNWLNYFANNSETRYLGLAGGTLTGPVTLSGPPTTGLNPTTKTYVDAADATLTTAVAAAQTTANAALPKSGGTMTGAITLAADPTAPLQPATKQYTDAATLTLAPDVAAAQATANAALPKAGGTMTGAITLAADPAAALQPATKQYTDTAVNLRAPLASPTLTGTPLAPTATAGTNTTQIATTAFVTASDSATLSSANTTAQGYANTAQTNAQNASVPTARTVSAGTQLSGGGALSGNVTLSHATVSTQADVDVGTGLVIKSITLSNGHVTGIGTANYNSHFFNTIQAQQFPTLDACNCNNCGDFCCNNCGGKVATDQGGNIAFITYNCGSAYNCNCNCD
jgi:hypothetical protein